MGRLPITIYFMNWGVILISSIKSWQGNESKNVLILSTVKSFRVSQHNWCLSQLIDKFFALNIIDLFLDIIATVPNFLFLYLSLRMIAICMAKIRSLTT